MSTIQHLINGEMVSDSGRTADVYNPSTGKVIHQVPLASRETIQKAIDAAKAAFEVIREAVGVGETQGETVIIATVHGDIHDIGKNIVKVLLENYGYRVLDLGKDVPVEAVVEAAKKTDAKVVGLSALMTTTVGAMEETIAALHNECNCQVVVGGAVLTQEYADTIGAEHYAPNAVSAVNYVNEILGK